VFISCWSVKGGSGTTVVAATLALLLASDVSYRGLADAAPGALLADFGGDVPAVLGLAEPTGDGVLDWLASDAGPAALPRLELDGGGGLAVLPRGAGPVLRGRTDGDRVRQLAEAWAVGTRPVVADLGLLSPRWHELAAGATTSLLVIRPCYLALRRALEAPLRPSGVVLVDEPARSLGRRDVEEVLQVPVVATVEFDPMVARAVDAGLLAGRLPRQLARSLRAAA
jgi:hypothetical protein